jgi:hypothetical protein
MHNLSLLDAIEMRGLRFELAAIMTDVSGRRELIS